MLLCHIKSSRANLLFKRLYNLLHCIVLLSSIHKIRHDFLPGFGCKMPRLQTEVTDNVFLEVVSKIKMPICKDIRCSNVTSLYLDIRITKVLLQQCRYVPTSFNHRVQQVHAGEHVGFGLSGPEHLQFFGNARIVVVIVLRDVIAVISHSTQSQCSQSTIQSSPVRLFSSKPKNLIAILCVQA